MRQPMTTILILCLGLLTACTSQKIESRAAANKTGCEDATDDEAAVDQDGEPCMEPDPTADADDPDGTATDGTDLPEAKPKDFLEGVTPLTDEEAMTFLTDNCESCHDSKNGSVRSFWSYDKEAVTKEKLAGEAATPRVFYSMVMQAKGIVGGKPSAMPPKLAKKKKAELLSMVKWMAVEMPAVVTEAKVQFGNGSKDDSLGTGVILDFKCAEPATFREFMRRVTNDAFGREPTKDELSYNGTSPEDPATAEVRKKVADRLFADKKWKAEFEEKGLRKFANKISGSGDIKAQTGSLTAAQADDLKDEFYQILKKSYAASAYKDILLSDTVRVSAETAAFYGCPAPAAGEWADCKMVAPRGSYFTTLSYLASKPSSFLRENNNYGRAALMHFIVRGDVFKAAFDQSGGTEQITPLPKCFKTKDFRGKNTGTSVAWQGAGAIPLTANLCQSCHIDRQMAAGAILFRPFNAAGLQYGPEHLIDADPDYANAVKADVVNRPNLEGADQVVDKAFLEMLLAADGEQACVPGDDEDAEVKLNKVKDMAKYLIGDGAVLAGGLARHLPRAMSNLQNTSEEIVIKVNEAFTKGDGKLAPAFKAYFASETYGCKK